MNVGRKPFRSGVVRLVFAFVFLLCAAPTPGDIGGCGQRVQPLGAEPFYESKKKIDCAKCGECSFSTNFCKTACDPDEAVPENFPEGCDPIVHDGEVCLNALEASGCDDYEAFVKDEGRQAPNECRFCPMESP
jgi:hypothetical protein